MRFNRRSEYRMRVIIEVNYRRAVGLAVYRAGLEEQNAETEAIMEKTRLLNDED